MNRRLPIALSIAGSDPSGGAGVQADLKTFHQFGVYGAAAITLITVQNTQVVSRVERLAGDLIGGQIDAVLADLPPQAVKTGALGSVAAIEAVAGRRYGCPVVVDPVLASTHGLELTGMSSLDAMRRLLLPHAALVTPNLSEAAQLSGIEVASLSEMKEAARRIAGYGPGAVLVKGGHLAGDEAIDVLWVEERFVEFRGARIATGRTHGTGCTLSAAITALLARGVGLAEAVGAGRNFVRRAIGSAPEVGSGNGPVDHFADPGIPL